jgi:hypothetical protein
MIPTVSPEKPWPRPRRVQPTDEELRQAAEKTLADQGRDPQSPTERIEVDALMRLARQAIEDIEAEQ